jgi:hypothetical protein
MHWANASAVGWPVLALFESAVVALDADPRALLPVAVAELGEPPPHPAANIPETRVASASARVRRERLWRLGSRLSCILVSSCVRRVCPGSTRRVVSARFPLARGVGAAQPMKPL